MSPQTTAATVSMAWGQISWKSWSAMEIHMISGVSFFQALHSLRGSSHSLEYNGNGPCFPVIITDRKRNRQLDHFYEALRNRRIELSAEESRYASVSAGFACTEDAGQGIEELLSQADEALYEVKRRTKGCYSP